MMAVGRTMAWGPSKYLRRLKFRPGVTRAPASEMKNDASVPAKIPSGMAYQISKSAPNMTIAVTIMPVSCGTLSGIFSETPKLGAHLKIVRPGREA
jgi:hypothetical protein